MASEVWRGSAAVAQAIRAGKLPPVAERVCADCGRAAQAYHHDQGYAPEHLLNVVPLCDRCHSRRHVAKRPPRTKRRSERVIKLLRFPPMLQTEIETLAQREDRSFTAQVLRLLREAIEHGWTQPE